MTNKTQHTPGPWAINICKTPSGKKRKYIIYKADHSGTVAEVGSYRDDGRESTLDNMHADARLIAASPSMLQALEYVVKMLEAPKNGQGIIYSDTLGPNDDDQTIFEYLQEQIRTAKGE